jgi:ribosome-associated heat shock protein Hsp15
VRLNRQPTDKPHARLRPGDVVTFAVGPAHRGQVRVWRVLALAARRGPPAEAQGLYEDLSDPES